MFDPSQYGGVKVEKTNNGTASLSGSIQKPKTPVIDFLMGVGKGTADVAKTASDIFTGTTGLVKEYTTKPLTEFILGEEETARREEIKQQMPNVEDFISKSQELLTPEEESIAGMLGELVPELYIGGKGAGVAKGLTKKFIDQFSTKVLPNVLRRAITGGAELAGFTAAGELAKGEEVTPQELGVSAGIGASISAVSPFAGKGFQFIKNLFKGGKEKIAGIDTTLANTLNPTRAIPAERQAEIIKQGFDNKATTSKLESLFKTAERAVANPRNITPMEEVGKWAEDTLSKLKKTADKYGQQISSEVKANAEKKVSGTGSAINEFNQALKDRLGVEIKKINGKLTIKTAEGRVSSLDSADMKLINQAYDKLNKIQVSPTLQKVNDVVTSLNDLLFKKRQMGAEPINTRLEGALKEIINNLNTSMQKTGGQKLIQSKQGYSNLINLYQDFNKALGEKGKRGASLMKRVFSPQDSGTKQMFSKIKEITGDDLIENAVLAKFVMEASGDVRQRSLLEGIDILGAKAGLLGRAINFLGKKIVDPKKTALEISKGTNIDEGIINRVLQGDEAGIAKQTLDNIKNYFLTMSSQEEESTEK